MPLLSIFTLFLLSWAAALAEACCCWPPAGSGLSAGWNADVLAGPSVTILNSYKKLNAKEITLANSLIRFPGRGFTAAAG